MAKRKIPKYPSGPACIADLIRLPASFGKEIRGHLTRDKEFVVTSNYSGTGAFECAAHAVLCGECGASEAMSQTVKLSHYSACDTDPAARQALMSHPLRTRPQHVFGDVCCRVPSHSLSELRAIETQYLELWEGAKAELSLGAMTKHELTDRNAVWGDEYVGLLLRILAVVEFNTHAFCYVHMQLCFISPRCTQVLVN
jgi:hypothetical protein